MDLFFSNVRVPEERRADFMCVMGAFWTADKRLREILQTFGLEQIAEAYRVTRDRAQRRMQDAIAELPEGEFSYELNLDSNGVEPGWVPLRVNVVIRHRPEPTMTVDFSDSAPEVPGPMNGARATAACGAITAIKAFLDPHSPINGGTFRPIHTITKPGTIFEAQPPSAMCGSLDLGYRVIEVVMGALGSIRPEDAVGDFSSPAHLYLPVWDPQRQQQYVFYEIPIGGTGAVSDHDGSDAVAGFERGDFARVSSVEIWEHRIALRAVENVLIPDSGGAGKFRGGIGMRRSWRLLEESSAVSDLSEPCLVPNYGVLGAYGGTPSTCWVHRGDEIYWPGGVTGTGKATRFPMQCGDIVQFDKWGAGGYGDPLERDPERVREDLGEGYISAQSARDVYGVVIQGGVIDIPGTKARRERLAAQRVFVSLLAEEEDTIDEGTRLWKISPDLAERLQAKDGHVLECINADRAPLRGKARIVTGLPPDRMSIGPVGRKVLGVKPPDTVWLRKVPGALYPKG